ncbi:MAG: preprotein translocase subunit SecY [candidate division WOR-3 bacterium]
MASEPAIERIKNLFKIKDLKERFLFTAIVLIIFRLGTHIPIPGIDTRALGELFAQQLRGSFLGLFDLFVGGALSRASILGIGIMPYISASIIFQILTTSVPYLEKIQREGEAGRRRIEQWTRYLTVLVAAIQSFGISSLLTRFTSPSGLPIVPHPGIGFTLLTVITLSAGAVFCMWLGEQITDRGIGNGASLLIFVGSLDTVPQEVFQTFGLLKNGAISLAAIIFAGAILFLITYAIVFMNLSSRKIPVQYARRIIGRKVYGGASTHLPLKMTTAGVMAIIFAQSLMILPYSLGSFFPQLQDIMIYTQLFNPGHLLYDLVYGILIIFFNYFYTAVILNPKDIADNLQKFSGFIPGVRPGDKTAEYIDNVLKRILLPGGIFIALIAILPYYISKITNVPFYFGGTRLLIIIGVAQDTLQQIESHLLTRQYEGLLQKGRFRGRRG